MRSCLFLFLIFTYWDYDMPAIFINAQESIVEKVAENYEKMFFSILDFHIMRFEFACCLQKKYFEENYEEFEPTQNLPLCKSKDFILEEICSNVYGVLSKILEN